MIGTPKSFKKLREELWGPDSIDLPIGMLDQPSPVVKAFRRMVAAGESPRLAEMFAVRKAPRLDTDTVYKSELPTIGQLEKTLGKPYVDKVREQAKKAGISINAHSVYNGSAADERAGGDPGAWLLVGDGKDKFKKTAMERGLACPTLGVEHFQSQKRVDEIQPKIAKQRKFNHNRRVMKEQVLSDKHNGHKIKM